MIEDDLTDKEIGKAILFSRFLFSGWLPLIITFFLR